MLRAIRVKDFGRTVVSRHVSPGRFVHFISGRATECEEDADHSSTLNHLHFHERRGRSMENNATILRDAAKENG